METGLKNNFSEAFKPDARNEAIMSIIIIFMNIVIFTIPSMLYQRTMLRGKK